MSKTLLLSICLAGCAAQAFQKVDLNQASCEQIALLPGVGDKLARDIVMLRQKKGALDIDDLKQLSSMSDKKLQQMKAHILFSKGMAKKQSSALISLEAPVMPKLPELEQAMLRALKLGTEQEAALKERVRKSAMLPQLSLVFDVDRDEDTSKRRRPNKEEILERGGVDLGFSLKACFDLPKLLFNSAELDVETLSLKRLEKREKSIAHLHELYFRYIKLLEARKKPNDAQNIDELSAKMREVAAAIDSMSAGAFTLLQNEGK